MSTVKKFTLACCLTGMLAVVAAAQAPQPTTRASIAGAAHAVRN